MRKTSLRVPPRTFVGNGRPPTRTPKAKTPNPDKTLIICWSILTVVVSFDRLWVWAVMVAAGVVIFSYRAFKRDDEGSEVDGPTEPVTKPRSKRAY